MNDSNVGHASPVDLNPCALPFRPPSSSVSGFLTPNPFAIFAVDDDDDDDCSYEHAPYGGSVDVPCLAFVPSNVGEPCDEHTVPSPAAESASPLPMNDGNVIRGAPMESPSPALPFQPPVSSISGFLTPNPFTILAVDDEEDDDDEEDNDDCFYEHAPHGEDNDDCFYEHAPHGVPVVVPSLAHASSNAADPLFVAFSDGGHLKTSNLMSGGYWISDPRGLQRTMRGIPIYHGVQSSNVAEFIAAISCLVDALRRGVTRLHLFMDSKIIVSMVTGDSQCAASHLRPLLATLMGLCGRLSYFVISHVLREHNKGADFLCNAVFDNNMAVADASTHPGFWNVFPAAELPHALALPRPSLDTWVHNFWKDTFRPVVAELRSLGPMIRDISRNAPLDQVFSPIEITTVPEVIHTGLTPEPNKEASYGPQFPFILSPDQYASMRTLACNLGVTWDLACFRRRPDGVIFPPPPSFCLPLIDRNLVMRMLRACNMDVSRVIRAWRAQTPNDPRPSKELDPARVKAYLKRQGGTSFPLTAFEDICRDGFAIPWKNDTFVGARPLPRNHPSADDNAAMVVSKLMAQYNLGRLLPIDAIELAAACPSFAASPYGLVEKNNQPLSLNGRPIHNQSFPPGVSVNDQIDQSRAPDAYWDGAPKIADRAIARAREFGADSLYAFNTDIKDAFNTVHLKAEDAPINGSIVPGSNLGLISLVCTFGNGCSGGGFKTVNIVAPLHRMGGSMINGRMVPFDCSFYVDDGNYIEPNVGTRLHDAEAWARDVIGIVFGPYGINESKTESWASVFRSLGFLWDLRRGTVSIPPDKLARAKDKLTWLIRQDYLTNTQLMSATGLLRHLAVCCPPANALVQRLGGGISAFKSEAKRKIHVSQAMRSDLRWWIDHLDAASFDQMPLEWLASSPPPVDRWLHVYLDAPNECVWVVQWGSRRVFRQHCDDVTSRCSVRLATIAALDAISRSWPSNHARVAHTRVILDSCHLANTINRCASNMDGEMSLLRSFGLQQLATRTRFTATSHRWEDIAPASISLFGCHDVNLSNLFVLMSQNTPYRPQASALRSGRSTPNGWSNPSSRGPTGRIGHIGSTGAYSSWSSICRLYSSMSTSPKTSALSCRGLRLPAPPVAITNKARETSNALTKEKNLPSFISTDSSGITPLSLLEQPSSSLNVPIRRCNLPHPTQCTRLPPRCFGLLEPISPSRRFGGNWVSTVWSSPISTCAEVGRCGYTPERNRPPTTAPTSNGPQLNLMNWPTLPTIGSNTMRYGSTMPLGSNSLPPISEVPNTSRLSSSIPKRTKSDEATSSDTSDRVVLSFAPSSLLQELKQHDGRCINPTDLPSAGPYPQALKRNASVPSSSPWPSPSEKTRPITRCIPFALAERRPCLAPVSTVW